MTHRDEPLYNHHGMIRNARLLHWEDIDARRETLVRAFKRDVKPHFSDTHKASRLFEDDPQPLPIAMEAICGDYLQLEKLEAMRVGAHLCRTIDAGKHVLVLYSPDSALHTALGLGDGVHNAGHEVTIEQVRQRAAYPQDDAAPWIDKEALAIIPAVDEIILCDSTISSGTTMAHALEDIQLAREAAGATHPVNVTIYSNVAWFAHRDAAIGCAISNTHHAEPKRSLPLFHTVWDEKKYTNETGIKLRILLGSDSKAHDIFDRGNAMAIIDHPQAHRWRDYLYARDWLEQPLSEGLQHQAQQHRQKQHADGWHQRIAKDSVWGRSC